MARRPGTRKTPPASARAADKRRHRRDDRRTAPALRGSDWPATDLLAAGPTAGSRKRARTSAARSNRLLH